MKQNPSFRHHNLRQQFNVPSHGGIPSCNTILMWICKFEDTGSVRDIPHGAPRTVGTEERVHRVRESFQRSPRRSVWQQSRQHTLLDTIWTWSTISSIRLFHVLDISHGQHVHRTSRYQTSFCGDICKNEYTGIAPTQHRTWSMQLKMKLLSSIKAKIGYIVFLIILLIA
jgi:hypothetical protein